MTELNDNNGEVTMACSKRFFAVPGVTHKLPPSGSRTDCRLAVFVHFVAFGRLMFLWLAFLLLQLSVKATWVHP
jgi:hypothetical protein